MNPVGGAAFDTWQLVALAAALGWASGIRLYAVLFIVGAVGYLHWVALPGGLIVLAHPWVLAASGFMFCVEFFADKVPIFDSAWDLVHTFIRIPAGAALAASVFGDSGAAATLAAAILGGSLAAGSHLTKTGSRALINTSPEPFSNWAASFGEELTVGTLLWLAFTHPLVTLVVLALLIALMAWLVPKLWRFIRSAFAKVAGRPATAAERLPMFDRILIANRGEIACRIARTARRMGIRTVAVYSDADTEALHVAACDEAFRLGPPPPRDSYLDGAAILAIARQCGAGAIHPGYGFLSENEAFAAACAAAGVVFIGPPPSAIAAMGSKSAAKRIMEAAKVPLVPGYHGEAQDERLLAREAAKIGYPVLIKATAGGGGKGMKVAAAAGDFAAALASAQREAKSAFGDDRVLVEKYLTAPRHIEIQVFADTHGNAVYMFERDCSVQRRHQKVLEEAPAPGMKPGHRRAMGEAAVAAARAIGYVGAGTVEFIAADTFAQDGAFFFMEMNTRLQVEHPVTEMITGLDLVEWQLRVAAGEPLPKRQDELAIDGHAIEARIYAEDPERGFLPSIGTLAHLRAPDTDADVRVDTGVREGDVITPYYDPMIAKLVVHGEDRPAALRRMGEALAEYEIAGVATNIALLQRIVAHEAFASGRVDTGLIERHRTELFAPLPPLPEAVLAAAAAAEADRLVRQRAAEADATSDRHSPWNDVDPWWQGSTAHALAFRFAEGDATHDVALRRDGQRWRIDLPSGAADVRWSEHDGRLAIVCGGAEYRATVVALGEMRHIFCGGTQRRLRLVDPLAHAGEVEVHGGHLIAPMSGTVIAVMVKVGDRVAKGAPLVILEAMKMEHTIVAPGDGVVRAINFCAGDRVGEGADLVDVHEA